MPYTVAGNTAHFIVQYDSAMGPAGLVAANVLLGSCEAQYSILSVRFGNLTIQTIPITIQLENLTGGGFNNNTNFMQIKAGVAPNVDSFMAQWIMVAELSEIFMVAQAGGWNPANGKGEGLSRLLAFASFPASLDVPNLYQFQTANFWLNNGRPDWITANNLSDTDPAVNGCSILFLAYLNTELGYSLPQIIASKVNPLSAVYQDLTGRSGYFGRDCFLTLLNSAYPTRVPDTFPDNPFPIARGGS